MSLPTFLLWLDMLQMFSSIAWLSSFVQFDASTVIAWSLLDEFFLFINEFVAWSFYDRVEFEASIDLNSAEDEGDNMPSIIDEEEWTQQNFGDSLRLAQGISILVNDITLIIT